MTDHLQAKKSLRNITLEMMLLEKTLYKDEEAKDLYHIICPSDKTDVIIDYSSLQTIYI